MATFRIHEDSENIHNKENKINNVKEVSRKRVALQSLKNDTKKDVKRAKLCDIKKKSFIPILKSEINNNDKVTKNEDVEKINLKCLSLVDNKKNEQDKKKQLLKFKEELLFNLEYSQDVWKYLYELEGNVKWPKTNYMEKQTHLNFDMRSILVDWLVAVALEYKMSEQILHLAIYYVDRFLSHMSVVKEKFQLLGSAAMMVAGKLEDVYPPTVKEWIFLTQDTYSFQQFIRMEQLLLQVLDFELQTPTTFTFIQQFCIDHKLDNQTKYLALYLSELVLLEGEGYLNYLPSQLAASAVALARLTLSVKEPWPKELKTSSRYSLAELSPVLEKQNKSFRDSPTKSQQAIQTKYLSEKYHKVALIKPKRLNLVQLHEC